MNNLIHSSGSSAPTMSSREIAELTGKRHDNVMADIRSMLDALGLMCPDFSGHIEVAGPKGGLRKSPVFNLPKDLTITLVSGYSVPMRHKIVTRWQQLEAGAAVAPSVGFNDPSWLRQALLSYTEKVLELKPKADGFDRISGSGGSMCVRDAAASLKVPERKLIDALIAHRWAYRRSTLRPMAEAMRAGVVEAESYTQSVDGESKVRERLRITAKGLTRLAEKWIYAWGLASRPVLA